MNRIEHLLFTASEECNEVGQRCSKAARFSVGEVQPGQPFDNAARIEAEFLDLLAVMEMLAEEGVVRPLLLLLTEGSGAIEAKKAKVERYMVYAREQGSLHG